MLALLQLCLLLASMGCCAALHVWHLRTPVLSDLGFW